MAAPKRMALIASRGTLDGAYPPFILASSAAALNYEVSIFFTFYGLTLLRRRLDLSVSPLGNPAFPMPKGIPVLLQAMPGMEGFASGMMKRQLAAKNTPTVEELRDLCLESGVKMVACTMTMDLFGLGRDDLIDGLDYGGAASFLEFAGESDINLYI